MVKLSLSNIPKCFPSVVFRTTVTGHIVHESIERINIELKPFHAYLEMELSGSYVPEYNVVFESEKYKTLFILKYGR